MTRFAPGCHAPFTRRQIRTNAFVRQADVNPQMACVG